MKITLLLKDIDLILKGKSRYKLVSIKLINVEKRRKYLGCIYRLVFENVEKLFMNDIEFMSSLESGQLCSDYIFNYGDDEYNFFPCQKIQVEDYEIIKSVEDLEKRKEELINFLKLKGFKELSLNVNLPTQHVFNLDTMILLIPKNNFQQQHLLSAKTHFYYWGYIEKDNLEEFLNIIKI